MASTNINTLKEEIMSIIKSEVDTVHDVSDYDKINFDGYPAVTVTVTDNENEFWSVGENQRAFNFDVDVFQQISKSTQSVDDNARQSAERIMGNVVSDMIDAFDDNVEFGGEADFLRAAPSTWDYMESAAGFMRHAKIKLQVVKLYTTS